MKILVGLLSLFGLAAIIAEFLFGALSGAPGLLDRVSW